MAAMIDDQELRTLFKAESTEHIQRLEAGLLHLEANPQDRGVLEEVFREAHSLKGAARMVGVHKVERLAHQLEEVLGTARHGQKTLSPETIDHLCRQLDTMRHLVAEAVGETAAAQTPAPESSAPVPASPEHEEHMAIPLRHGWQEPDGTSRFHTIRVDPARLDALMRHARELAVTRLRLQSRLKEIKALLAYEETWDGEVRGQRWAASQPQQALADQGTPGLAIWGGHAQQRPQDRKALLHRLHQAISEDSAQLDLVASAIEESVRTLRLLPLATVLQPFPRLVRDLARVQGKEVHLHLMGEETMADKQMLEEIREPLVHLIRNAIDHGLEPPDERVQSGKPRAGNLWLRAFQTGAQVVIEVADDGRGLDLEAIKRTALARGLYREEQLDALTEAELQALIFLPGFSTSPLVTDISGRGVGLDVVRARVESLKGTLHVQSAPGQGCTFRVTLPVSLITTRVLLVTVHKRPYAIPVEAVRTLRLLAPEEIVPLQGQPTIVLDSRPVPLAWLADLLGLQDTPLAPTPRQPCVIIAVGREWLGLCVDALLDEQEVVVKPHGALLKRVRNVAGATLLGTGEVCIVLHPADLVRTANKRRLVAPAAPPHQEAQRRPVILLVEDSIVTRTQEKRILENAGYQVVTAVDGVEALSKLQTHSIDAIVADIEMPHLDGIALTTRIRQQARYRELPVILVTSLASEEDKKRGLLAGADAYLTKPSFDQKVLLETLRRFL